MTGWATKPGSRLSPSCHTNPDTHSHTHTNDTPSTLGLHTPLALTLHFSCFPPFSWAAGGSSCETHQAKKCWKPQRGQVEGQISSQSAAKLREEVSRWTECVLSLSHMCVSPCVLIKTLTLRGFYNVCRQWTHMRR